MLIREVEYNEDERRITGLSGCRHDYQEMPPRVEYGLTELGKEMLPIIDALADFGNYYQSVVKQ